MAKKKIYPVTRPMASPVHPGVLLKELVIKPLKLTVNEAAKQLDVDRTTLSRLINGHIAISVEMALRLSKAVADSSPEFWLNLQLKYDLAKARATPMNIARVGQFAATGVFA